jgi:hypothetical protein
MGTPLTSENTHRPIDKAVFAILNGSVFGIVMSLSWMHKNNPEYSLTLKNKFRYTMRNVFTIACVLGMNVYISEYMDSTRGRKRVSELLAKNNYPEISPQNYEILKSTLCSFIPTTTGFFVYKYQNKFPVAGLGSSTFFYLGILLFIFDYFSIYKNKNQSVSI